VAIECLQGKPTMPVEKFIKYGVGNPGKLFLVDGLGAILSAVLWGVVFVIWDFIIGIPRPSLIFLAVFPCLFALYDLFCFLNVPRRTGAFLQGIAMMNLSYVFLSIGLAMYHYASLTGFGWMYMVIELVVVLILAFIEFSAGKRLGSRPN
jgi:hypothetical protein